MKKLLIIFFMLFTTTCMAQCVGEIKDVVQDEKKGSIKVITEYSLNGQVVKTGVSGRYLETSGTNDKIIERAKDDIKEHCKNIIRRIKANKEYRNKESLRIQKSLTTPIITDIKDDLVGYKATVSGVVDTFKNREIRVTYDKKNTVKSIVGINP